MKIGVISDTHLREVTPALIDIYEHYFSDVEMIFHAGDVVSMEVVEYLNRKPLNIVQGNMDSLEIRKRFPKKKIVEVEGFRLGLIHGWGSPVGIEKRIRSEFDNVHAIIYGHSHRAANHSDNDVLFFNPGSAAGPGLSGSYSIGVLDIGESIKGNIVIL